MQIIKIYTLETDLYEAINTASCTRDQSKVQTLGPYAKLWHECLFNRNHKELNEPIYALEEREAVKFKNHWSKFTKTFITIYRGLSLTRKAVEAYKQSKGEIIQFNGFTSTSIDRNVAKDYAIDYLKEGNIPIIFEILTEQKSNGQKFLCTPELSAFPQEKEVLLARVVFFILDSEDNFKVDRDGIMVIKLCSPKVQKVLERGYKFSELKLVSEYFKTDYNPSVYEESMDDKPVNSGYWEETEKEMAKESEGL